MKQQQEPAKQIKRPSWLKKRVPTGSEYEKVGFMLNNDRIHTVCREAKCPNIWECFSRKTATFMIMGPCCTRNCRFCAVEHKPVNPVDAGEPARIAEAVRSLRLSYVVITSVTRDDLPDGGASYFSKTVEEIRKKQPNIFVELLIPDFKGNDEALKTVVDVHPDVLSHNIETVPRLYTTVRPEAIYGRSLHLLKKVNEYAPSIHTKSGFMLGLGESSEEVYHTLKDLLSVGCRLLTLGQYLQPTQKHLPVKCFIHPEKFENWRKIAIQMGFAEVASGPFVRSSYQAEKLYQSAHKSFSKNS